MLFGEHECCTFYVLCLFYPPTACTCFNSAYANENHKLLPQTSLHFKISVNAKRLFAEMSVAAGYEHAKMMLTCEGLQI